MNTIYFKFFVEIIISLKYSFLFFVGFIIYYKLFPSSSGTHVMLQIFYTNFFVDT